ncbi:hypothetical protein, conserved [Plasmodium gonderi]|uniref:Uncharacterized protein n=1 Tax=Plasmodium gonderi TaxID=77519 RepID=A0A1Y1JL65_PLAGO|nr:hypothetical protein, conserved [Plasmodium gonderi]GAW81153.1 hypothetical protein, conserved [Plasmodium gonderi]
MKNVKQSIINFKDLAKQLEACVQYNSTDIEVMQDIYAECKKDLIILEKLTLEALEKGNAYLFEQLVEASTHVSRSIKRFESFEKNHKDRSRSFPGEFAQIETTKMDFGDEDFLKKKKKHQGHKKHDNKKKGKKYKNMDYEEGDSVKRNRSRSQSRSRSRSCSRSESLGRSFGRRKEHEKKKKKTKEKERRKYYHSDDESNNKEKYTYDNKKMLKSDSFASFNKELGTLNGTPNMLSSELDEDLDDFQKKPKKDQKKKKKKLHDNKLKVENADDSGDDSFFNKTYIDSLDDLNPLSSNNSKNKKSNRGKERITHISNNPLVIIIHISDIINVSLDFKTIYIYLTLKSLDNKINIRKKSKNKQVDNFTINVSELFEFSVFYNNQLFLYIDVVDTHNNTYYYTCLINLNKNILKKTLFYVPTAYLLTQVTDPFSSHKEHQNLIPTTPVSFSSAEQSFGAQNATTQLKDFNFSSPILNSFPEKNNLGCQPVANRNMENHIVNNNPIVSNSTNNDLFQNGTTNIYHFNNNLPHKRVNEFYFGRASPSNTYSMNNHIYNPGATNFNFSRNHQNGTNSNNFNFVSRRNVMNRNMSNFNFINPNVSRPNVISSNASHPIFENPNFRNPNIGTSNFGNPTFGNPSNGTSNFGTSNYGTSNFGTSNFGTSNTGSPSHRSPSTGTSNLGRPNFSARGFSIPTFRTPNYEPSNFDIPMINNSQTSNPTFDNSNSWQKNTNSSAHINDGNNRAVNENEEKKDVEKEKKKELEKNERNFSSKGPYIIMNIFLKNKNFDHETELMKQNNLNLYKQLYNTCNKEKVYYENKSKENEKKIEQLDKAVMILELDNEGYIEANNKLKEIIETNKEIIKVIEKIIKKKNYKIEKLEKKNEKAEQAKKTIEENKKENCYLSEQIAKLNNDFKENKIKLKDSSQVNDNLNSKVNNLLFQLQNAQIKNEKLLLYLSYLVKYIHKNSCNGNANVLNLMKLKKINWNLLNSDPDYNSQNMLDDIANNCNYVRSVLKFDDSMINRYMKSQKKENINRKFMQNILGLNNTTKQDITNYSSENSENSNSSLAHVNNKRKENGILKGQQKEDKSKVHRNNKHPSSPNAIIIDEKEVSEEDEEEKEKDIPIDHVLVQEYKKYMTTNASNDINQKYLPPIDDNHPDIKKKKEKLNEKKGIKPNGLHENYLNTDIRNINYNSDKERKNSQRHNFNINTKRLDKVQKEEENQGEKKNYRLFNDEKKTEKSPFINKRKNSIQILHHQSDILHDGIFNHQRDNVDIETNSVFSFNIKNSGNLSHLKKSKRTTKDNKIGKGECKQNDVFKKGLKDSKEMKNKPTPPYKMKKTNKKVTSGKNKNGKETYTCDYNDGNFLLSHIKMDRRNKVRHSLHNCKEKAINKLVYNENYTFSNGELSSYCDNEGCEDVSKMRNKNEKNVVSDSYLNCKSKNQGKKINHKKLPSIWNGLLELKGHHSESHMEEEEYEDEEGEDEEDEDEEDEDNEDDYEKADGDENEDEGNLQNDTTSGKYGKLKKGKRNKNKQSDNRLKKKRTSDYLSDYKSFEKKFNYFVKVSKNLQGSILSNNSDKISYAVNLNKKNYFRNLERIINKCNKKDQELSYLDSYLSTEIKSNFLSDNDIKKHKNRLRHFYSKNTKGIIFENTLVKIYAKLYYVNEDSRKNSKKKKGLIGTENYNKDDTRKSNGNVKAGDDKNDDNNGNSTSNRNLKRNRLRDEKRKTMNKVEKSIKKENIYMNIYVKSILYNIIYIKSDLRENKMDHIKVVKRNLKKNYNKVTEENDYINLKKNEICLLYTLCFRKNLLHNLPLFLNIECLNNDNSTIKFRIALPLPHLHLLKPNSLYLNNFVKNFPGRHKYYYKSYYCNMIDFSTFNEFINSIKLYNSFNVFHFDAYNILYSTYPLNAKNNILLLIVCDFVRKKNGTPNGTVKLHFISQSNSLISFSVNLFKQIL